MRWIEFIRDFTYEVYAATTIETGARRYVEINDDGLPFIVIGHGHHMVIPADAFKFVTA